MTREKTRALRVLRLGGACFVALLLGALAATPASAEVTNGCRGTVAGQEVDGRSSTNADDAIKVQWDQNAPVQVTAPAPITGYNVDLEYAGARFTVAQGATNGKSWSQEVPVKQFALYGVGLYKVIGSATGPGACSATFLIDIVGKDPLSTPVGVAASIVLAIGALGTAAAIAASALGSPGGAAKRYISDLEMIESNQLPPDRVSQYIESWVPPPDAISVPETVYVPPPDAISVPETYSVPPPDAISVPETYSVPPPDVKDVPGPPPGRSR